ncbi:hypothetical protein [Bacteroides sp. UBA939]|uniref:hypothetical protein n=1 Tax=Bacteroides sp. UBA939 TaxID=1946092 RepID=UPI0025B9C159|nr:hypothetical protein [Bacteroides sp. UBA939]
MKRWSYILTGILVMLFGSCIEDIGEGEDIFRGSLHVDLDVKGLTATTATRAVIPAEEGEDEIGSLYLLFFDSDATQNGRFIDYVKVNDVTGMSVDFSLAGTELTANAPYNILAVANIFDNVYVSDNSNTVQIDSWLRRWTGKRQRQVMLEATALVEGTTDEINAISPNRLLMSASISKLEGESNISLVLTRNVARLDVYNTQKDSYDLVSASIWNAYPTASIWDGVVADYSKEIARLGRFYGVDNRANSISDNGEAMLDDIVGGLYVFPNQVTNPEQNDKLTTCLIVGLMDHIDGTTSYYRVNIHPDDSPQMLVRNTVYRLTITGVISKGYDTEEMAYNGRGDNLLYQVNLWNMDDNGLIVQDENSILSLPTKTINIGRTGGEFDYSVFINSKLPNPMPLSISSQIYEPDDSGIVTSINGNIIHVKATPIAPDQVERRGIVMLSYAGLHAAINIVQSSDAEAYLKVTLPDGGIPTFPAVANISSGLITVNASGTWSAEVYMDGFSFAEGKLVSKIHSTDVAYVNDNKFRIYTNTTNSGEGIRQGFAVVTLDSDPENYSSVVQVAQKPASVIKMSPEQAVVNFNIDGSLFVPLPPATNVNTFNVRPNLVTGEDGQTEYVPDWEVTIVQGSVYDDKAMFKVTQQYDANVLDNNILTVNTVGPNYTGHRATVKVRISLKDDPSTFTEITLQQRSFQWNVPASQTVLGKGGVTPELKIDIPAEVTGLHYTVAIESFEPMSIYGDGANQQFAYLIDGDDPDATPYSGLSPNDISIGFKVGFPTLPMALIDAEPKVTIAVTLIEMGETKTFTVSQSKFVPRAVNALDVGVNAHGNLATGGNNPNFRPTAWDGTYQENLAQFLMNNNYFSPTGTVKTNGDPAIAKWETEAGFTTVWQVVKNNLTFVNYTRPGVNAFANNTIWDWLHSDSGFTLINSESVLDQGVLDYSSDCIPGQLGLQGGGGYMSVGSVSNWNVDGGFMINPDDSNPIIDYLVHSGPFGEVEGWQNLRIGNSGVNGYTVVSSIEPALGKGAVPIVQMVSNDPNCAQGQLITEMLIDPSLNLMIKNDSEFFYDDPTYFNDPSERPRLIFTLNLIAFMVNTAQYGSIFTNQFWDNPNNVRNMPQPQP